jgi:hypothetical protein
MLDQGPLTGDVSPTESPAWRRVRPVWLVLALCVTTFGLYSFYWFYATWRELKEEYRDPAMRPVWHTLAILFVPIYGLFRFHAHFRMIRELADRYGVSTSLSPGWAVIGWLITNAYSNGTLRLLARGIESPFWLDLVFTLIDAGLIVWAQSALNASWKSAATRPTLSRVHPVEWAVMIIGGGIVALSIFGSVAS